MILNVLLYLFMTIVLAYVGYHCVKESVLLFIIKYYIKLYKEKKKGEGD